MTFKDIYQLMSDSGFCERLKNNQTILKLTGGEPLIQQKKLSKFILYFNFRSNFMPRIDFETNGTILPDNVWTNYCGATFTVSPKLSSNGDPEDKRYVPEVLEWHANNIGGSYFKFVVQTEKDIEEIAEKYITKYSINADRVWFMPCCGSRAEHTENATRVAEWSKQWNVNFSPRLHLVLWDKALKV
jgi:organic radical activating enzyme